MNRINRSWYLAFSLVLATFFLRMAPASAQEALRVDPSGNVGIGISDPEHRLHVAKNIRIDGNGGNPQMDLFRNASQWWRHSVSGTNQYTFRDEAAATNIFQIEGGAPSASLYIHSSGDIGMGISSPTEELTIIGDDGDDVFISVQSLDSNTQNVGFQFVNAQSTFNFFDSQAGNFRISRNGLGTIMDIEQAGDVRFPAGDLTVDEGNLGVGTSTPGLRLAVEDQSTGGAVLRLQNDSQTCDYNPDLTPTCPSDRRLKRNIHPLDTAGVLAELGRIELFEYELIASGEGAIGPVAQELQRTHPGRVSEREDGMLVATMPSRMELLAAIQALEEMVVVLQERVEQLEPR